MKAKKIIAATALGAMIAGYGFSQDNETSDADKKTADVIVVDKKNASPFGPFEGWGTSFCWWANRIGYSDVLSQQAAELLYSNEGNSLGFNVIRFNIGGGDDPSHHHITRTDSNMPGYATLNEDGTLKYDWTADHNQRNVLLRALKVGGDGVIVEAFSNSAPYFMTYSGCSSGAEHAEDNNLRDDQYENFAEYMATVMEHYKKEWGVSFQSCDPMNEPATNYWGANSWKQEGCHFDIGESQSRMLVEMNKALKRHGLSKVILCGTDETSIDTQTYAFSQLSDEAKKVLKRIDVHTYEGVGREELRELAVANKKGLWMSEVDGGDRAGEDAGEMGPALSFAKRIVIDMNGLLPSTWIMWQAIDNHISKVGMNGNEDRHDMIDLNHERWGYWGLVVTDHDNEKIILTKKYFACAQFSKYIRPGCTILESADFSVSAYDPKKKQVVIVAVNDKKSDKEIQIDLSSFKKTGNTSRVIRTSGSMADGENIKELDPINLDGRILNATLLPNSVTTFIIDNVK
ncbi:O-glycosyl hydrolase [Treponema rectale]|uniref:O-glycosyl hydrolase n=1 Tax=Treponema rectale TaxID=744512 RepID=A0A840SDC1_9SPIR|nr:glycoside hydrolase [Treponema rectale]MBB5218730.1 O-glycosyl hydrolase [Treponema rectale]